MVIRRGLSRQSAAPVKKVEEPAAAPKKERKAHKVEPIVVEPEVIVEETSVEETVVESAIEE